MPAKQQFKLRRRRSVPTYLAVCCRCDACDVAGGFVVVQPGRTSPLAESVAVYNDVDISTEQHARAGKRTQSNPASVSQSFPHTLGSRGRLDSGRMAQQGGPGMPPGQPGTSGPPNGTGGKDDSYFTESRKGEVNELRTLLRTFGTEKDRQRKRDIMKKVRYNGQQDQTSKPKSVGPDSYAR